jgi:hypothetical protein
MTRKPPQRAPALARRRLRLLDRGIAPAYGWPEDISIALNLARAAVQCGAALVRDM